MSILVRDFFLRLQKGQQRKKNEASIGRVYQSEPDRTTSKMLGAKCKEIKNNVEYDLNITDTEFVVFDTETTGLKPYEGDEITSIAGVVVKNGEIQEDKVFSRLVNPMRHIPKKVEKLTGITNEMVEDKEPVGPVLCEFLEFIKCRPLVAHFASFDLTFLNLKLNWFCQEEIHNPVLDTFQLGQVLYPHLPSHSLDYLLEYLKIKVKGRHSAEGDAYMTAQVLINYINKLQKHNINTLQEVRDLIQNKDSEYYKEKFLNKYERIEEFKEFPYC
ncbi:PolC-type DNA polymerase III [Natranaerofaba carboxydovora]|uniref:3'-5' exonuclease n=1 Tax=Natranaerofaba carboxydovora TaxID=2742683 RepID=UPI001F12B05B|nr:3'-5' exonuclease [Natranaerofaba carboxydovora]UMZ74623.1 DNA polymerase III PolC-type [Natranaerofaba carboxydovora]